MNGAVKIIGFGLAALLATGVYTVVHQRLEERHAMRGFLDSVAVMRKQQGVQEAALQARFKQIDVQQYLQSTRLASSSDIADGRAELGRYRALLVDRDRLVDAELAQSQALLRALPEGRIRDGALRGAAKAKDRMRDLRDSLTQAQVANADAVQALFDWADRNHALVHARNGTLVVDGQRPLNDLNALNAHVGETGSLVDDALHRFNAMQSESMKTMDRLRHDNAD